MYLLITDYTWSETQDDFLIVVPLKGFQGSKSDTMITKSYLKLVIKPYLFECILTQPIIVEESRVDISGGCAHFTLRKAQPGIVGELMSDKTSKFVLNPIALSTEDKSELLKFRQEAVIEHQEREQSRIKAKKTQVREGEKRALSEVMQFEASERERIDKAKKEAGQEALAELALLNKQREDQNTIMEQKRKEACQLAKSMAEEKGLRNDDTFAENSVSHSLFEDRKPIVELPVRTSTTIPVTFTPRVFPTPERESRKQEEEEWLNKQAEHRKAMMKRVLPSADLSEKERDPSWLKSKGDSLFRAGDYEAAVEAFTKAIELNPAMHSAYSNRAACHLQLRNLFKALEDTSTVLKLCVPEVPQNLRSRLIAHVRRGAAFCQLKMYEEALVEYTAAHKLDPKDETIVKDLASIQEALTCRTAEKS
ncbi:unnamed protein product [Dicrocoelium dendriticum]|nr:unnamed protein product [Dicrocoelium dendriticum]